MTFLQYEVSIFFAMAILIAKVWPRLAEVPFLLKAVHFFLVGIFSLVGIDGVYILVLACSHQHRFSEMFSNKNPLGVGISCFQGIGIGFGLMGSILCVAALRLGDFKNWGRRAVLVLSTPYSVLYPFVMATVTGAYHASYAQDLFIVLAAAFLLALSVGTNILYKSKLAAKYFKYS